MVEGLRILLKGGTAVADLTTAFDITRSRPHGHVAAVLGTLRKLRLDRTLAATASPERERAIALIVARILAPGSKLATARGLAADTARDSLAEMLGIESVDEDELYAAMDWLLERQGTIEKRLARRHLSDGALVLYDLTSTYFEGRCCPLAKRGYSRDGRRDKLQIVFGLLCNREGCPVAVEVFDGNTRRPQHRRCPHREAAPTLRPLACGARRRPAGCSPRRASVRRSHRRGSIGSVRYVHPRSAS